MTRLKQLTFDFDANGPRPTGKYAEQLLELDSSYWNPFNFYKMDDPNLEINRIETERQLMHLLASWCFESGYLDEQDTQRELLRQIKDIFGSMMRYRVLICMQTGRHDT